MQSVEGSVPQLKPSFMWECKSDLVDLQMTHLACLNFKSSKREVTLDLAEYSVLGVWVIATGTMIKHSLLEDGVWGSNLWRLDCNLFKLLQLFHVGWQASGDYSVLKCHTFPTMFIPYTSSGLHGCTRVC